MEHARSIRPVFDYRITDVEAQIKTNKQISISALNGAILKVVDFKLAEHSSVKALVNLK